MKRIIFSVCKAIGLFALARYLTRGELRILCYHGFSYLDEHEFRPKLFMTADLFSRRMAQVASSSFNVIDLDTAVDRLNSGVLPANSLVITIDDGFFGVYELASPILLHHGFPSTLYLTTYYVQHSEPIFRIAMQYVFWKTNRQRSDLSGLVPGIEGEHDLEGEGGEHVLWRMIDYAEESLDEDARQSLLAALAQRLDVGADSVFAQRRFSLMSVEEARQLQASGMDIQLHTHRHRMPSDAAEIDYEIRRNREVLAEISPHPKAHFCYPSGVWDEQHWPALKARGIRTATTCVGGLNRKGTPPLALRRILDAQNLTDLEFEAELSGFKDLLRRAVGRVRTQAITTGQHDG